MQKQNDNLTNSDSATAALEHRLCEAFDELWDQLVDPREAVYDGADEDWVQLTGGAGGGRHGLGFSSEQQLHEIRTRCRTLAVTNEFAINGHENRISYIVGPGHSYRATGRAATPAADEVARQVQRVIDEFLRANDWHARQQEIVRRQDRDGEAFLRFFVDHDGSTRVRFVEPGQVATPPNRTNDPAATFGIQTDREDVETVLAYYIDGHVVDAGEVQHRKANVDANVKRGLPLFFPVLKNLRRAEKLLRNMSVVAEIQSAIALIRKHRGGTKTAVQQFVADQADHTSTNPQTGKTSYFRRYAPGTILDAPSSVDYDFPAAGLDAGSYVTVLQAELRAIAARLVMPEFMLTSDASNANYASTMIAEGPAVKLFGRLQAQQMSADAAVMRRVIDSAARAGALPAAALTDVDVNIEPPALVARDRLRDAQVSRIEHTSGILSPQTWSQRSGLNYQQEQTNMAQHLVATEKQLP